MTEEKTPVNITLGSLFDGIGGFPLAGLCSGIIPLWASEIEAFPIEVTKIRFPEMLHVGDITKLKGAELPPVDIVCGGSPCQDLSVAGQRKGLKGERSGLFMEQIRVIKEMRKEDEKRGRADDLIRPRYMVWENVPGAFSSADGEDFRAVLEETVRIVDSGISIPRPPSGVWKSAGCIMGEQCSIAWRILDAQYWPCTPQRRRRIFLVADFAGKSSPEILFEQDRLFGDTPQVCETWQRAAANSQGGTGGAGGDSGTVAFAANQRDELRDLHDVSGAIQAQPGMKQQTFVADTSPFAFHINQRNECIDLHDLSGALMRTRNMQMQTFVADTAPILCLNDQGGDRMDVTENQTSTLRAKMGGHQPLVAIPINMQTATRGAKPDTFGFGVGSDGDPAYTIQEARGHAVFQEGSEVRVTSAEVTEQTSSAAHLTGGTSSPVCPLQPPAGFGNEEATKITSPLGEQEGNMGRTESSPMRRTVSAANLATFAKVACAVQEECAPTLKGSESGTNMVPSILCLNDQGGSQMSVTENIVGTLRAQEHGHQPIVMGSQQGGKVRVTSAEVTEQTSSAAHLTGGTSSPVYPLQPPAGIGYEESTEVTSPLGEQEGHVGRTESSPTRHTGAKRPVISAEMTWVYEGHGKDARYNGPLSVAPTVASAYGEGGGNIPLAMDLPRVFSLDALASNSMRSSNPFSGCHETDIARTIDTTNTCPSKNQGGLAIVQESYCIAGNIIDRQDHNGGNGCGFQPDISYTLTSTDKHCVCPGTYQQIVGALCSGDEKGIGNQYVEQDKCIVESRNLIRRLTPLECERLQGYPTGWTLIPKCSDSARYKALGNSVAIPCVEYVLRGIAYFLQKFREESGEEFV